MRCRHFAICLVVLLVTPAAAQDVGDALRESARAVLQADGLNAQRRYDEIDLAPPMAALTNLIEAGTLAPEARSIAHYWRARAYSAQNWTRLGKGEAADWAAAQKSIDDFEAVIAAGLDVRGWGASVPEAEYFAGVVMRNHLENERLAYEYWQRCASREHPGCVGLIALARLTGAGGVAVDLEQSLELHQKVYATGTTYRCSGAFSALAIANTIYFARLKKEVDELAWMRRAAGLLDELGELERLANPCERAGFEISEYLKRLSRGERRAELLTSAAKRAGEADYGALARYLLGENTRESFEASLGAIPIKPVACSVRFLAWWNAELAKDARQSQMHLEAMKALDESCRISLAFVALRKK